MKQQQPRRNAKGDLGHGRTELQELSKIVTTTGTTHLFLHPSDHHKTQIQRAGWLVQSSRGQHNLCNADFIWQEVALVRAADLDLQGMLQWWMERTK